MNELSNAYETGAADVRPVAEVTAQARGVVDRLPEGVAVVVTGASPEGQVLGFEVARLAGAERAHVSEDLGILSVTGSVAGVSAAVLVQGGALGAESLTGAVASAGGEVVATIDV
jgi:hypothetical protein